MTERGGRILAQDVSSDPGVWIVFGLLLLGTLFVFWYEVEPVLMFRPVEAVVLGSDVARAKLVTTSKSGATEHERYQSEVFYRYEVSGTRYLSMRYRRIDLEISSASAWQHAHAYVAGGKVRAWYNPLRPDEAVLSRAPDVPMLLLSALVLFICLLGVVTKQWRSRVLPRNARAPAREPGPCVNRSDHLTCSSVLVTEPSPVESRQK